MWYISDTHNSPQNMTEFCITNQLYSLLSTECDQETILNVGLKRVVPHCVKVHNAFVSTDQEEMQKTFYDGRYRCPHLNHVSCEHNVVATSASPIRVVCINDELIY